MAFYQTRNSRFAIVREVTEGTPVAPTAATQYIALQEGFELTPNFEVNENAELTGNIGKAKPVLGLESPSGSLDHYLRHSGVEGQEPNYGLLLECLLGTKTVNAVQYNTTAGSTAGTASVRANIKSVGNAGSFQAGQALLLKDGVNGYSIRPVYAPSGADDLGLAFNLAVAPAASVPLGLAVLYQPSASEPTLSAWDYRGNGGAVQMAAGMRVLEGTINIEATQNINTSFSMEGTESFFNPIEITASTDTIDFTETGPTVRQATVPPKMYKDPYELAAALETVMDAVATDNITVSFSRLTGKFTIATSGSLLSLLWNTGAGTAQTIGTKLGFLVAADDTGALTYTSDNAQVYTSPQVPSVDAEAPLVAKDNELMIGDFADYECFSAQSVEMSIAKEKVDVLSICAASGKAGSLSSSREVSMNIVANLPLHDSDKFKKFRQGDTIAVSYSGGVKVGGNWVAGRCFNLYMKRATITSHALSDSDGVATLELEVTAFVQSSENEVFISFV